MGGNSVTGRRKEMVRTGPSRKKKGRVKKNWSKGGEKNLMTARMWGGNSN